MQIGGLPFPATFPGPLAIGYHTAAWPGNQYMAMTGGNTVSLYAGAGFATFTQFSGAQLYFGGSYETA